MLAADTPTRQPATCVHMRACRVVTEVCWRQMQEQQQQQLSPWAAGRPFLPSCPRCSLSYLGPFLPLRAGLPLLPGLTRLRWFLPV